eukprot:gene10300-4346_t
MAQREDKALTGDVFEMDRLLRAARVRPLGGTSYDSETGLDRLPQEILMSLMERLGLDPRMTAPLRGMYRGLQRRFRVGAAVGAPFTATNGVLQGCPVSGICLNALAAVWARRVEAEAPGTTTAAYAEDKWTLASGSPAGAVMRTLQAVAVVSADFAHLTGERFNVSKTFGIGTTHSARGAVRLDGARIAMRVHGKGLGVHLSARQTKRSAVATQRIRAVPSDGVTALPYNPSGVAAAASTCAFSPNVIGRWRTRPATATPRGLYGSA